MAEDNSLPKSIQNFYKLEKKIDHTVKVTDLEHQAAYVDALEVLPKNAQGEPDFEKLEEKEFQDKFIDRLSRNYVSRAKQKLGAEKDHKFDSEEDEKIYNERLLNEFAGISKGQLVQYVRKAGKNYGNLHKQIAQEHVKQVDKKLRDFSESELSRDDLENIVHYTKTSSWADHGKMDISQGAKFLRDYDEGKGAVGKGEHEKEIYFKKE